MRVFVTGATGFIGSAIVKELLAAGHQVLGLARSAAGAQALVAAGAEAHRGSLEELESLRSGAAQADGVIHCAYNNDFSKMEETSQQETSAITTLGAALVGSTRPFLVTSVAAMGMAAPGQLATENHFDPKQPNPRKATEIAAAAVAERGVQVSVVRLPQVHNVERQGIVSGLVELARKTNRSAYVGEGQNRWAAAHVLDVAQLFRRVLERQQAGRYHAVAEEGIALRQIAEVIGNSLHIPAVSLSVEEAKAHFGPLALFVGLDMPASSAQTRQQLGWQPTGPGLLQDLEQVR